MKYEAPGVEALKSIFGVTPSCWGGPGNTWGPQICAAMRRCGVPSFCLWFYFPYRKVKSIDSKIFWPIRRGATFPIAFFIWIQAWIATSKKFSWKSRKIGQKGSSGVKFSLVTRLESNIRVFGTTASRMASIPPEAERKSVEKKTEREWERTLRNFRKNRGRAARLARFEIENHSPNERNIGSSSLFSAKFPRTEAGMGANRSETERHDRVAHFAERIRSLVDLRCDA